jgi:hypothetical protein
VMGRPVAVLPVGPAPVTVLTKGRATGPIRAHVCTRMATEPAVCRLCRHCRSDWFWLLRGRDSNSQPSGCIWAPHATWPNASIPHFTCTFAAS